MKVETLGVALSPIRLLIYTCIGDLPEMREVKAQG